MDFTLDLKAVLTIISILTAITLALIFQWWRNRKHLTYQILTNTQLLKHDNEIRDKVQILVDGVSAENVQLMILKIINTGRQSIDEKDFKQNLDFVFSSTDSESVAILSADLSKKQPDNMKVRISRSDNTLSVEPIMLNYKDSFEIKVLLNSNKAIVTPDARITGVGKIQFDDKVGLISTMVLLLGGIFLISLLAVLIVSFGIGAGIGSAIYILVGLIVLLTAMSTSLLTLKLLNHTMKRFM